VIARPVMTCALLVALYYVLPVEPDVDHRSAVLRAIFSLLTGLAITWLIARQVSFHVRDPTRASPSSLLTALAAGLMFFALADYTVAISNPGQFVGLTTKTDGLYFALTTISTVGYGDVHAAGQVARGLVVVQLLFNVVVIATGASVLMRMMGLRARDRADDDRRG
jgi:hypothetical protein